MKKIECIMRSLGLFLLIAVPALAKDRPIVLGYSASWFDGLYPPESYNYEAFTHIARSFLLPKADGNITVQGGFFDPQLEKLAHAHGVKLLASIGGAAANADPWLAMARDPKAEKLFFDTLEKLIADNHYDGVDIDWEPSALTDADQATYTEFMKALRARFPKWILTTALGGGDYWAKHVSWREVAAQVDWVNLMTYTFAGGWTGHADHDANLYPSTLSKSEVSVDQEWDGLLNRYGLTPDKTVLGLPFFGVQFFTDHMGDPFGTDSSRQGAEIQYYEVAPLLAAGSGYEKRWDEAGKVPFLERKKGGHVVSYDDAKSLGLKCDYANKKGLKGVMIWNIGADVVGERTPLLDTVAKAYGRPAVPMPASGLLKTASNFVLAAKDSYGKLKGVQDKLQMAGKTAEAQAADPGPEPKWTLPATRDAKILGKKLWEIQYKLSFYNRKLQDSQRVLDALPVKTVAGAKIPATGNRVLVDNFEGGTAANALKGTWMTDMDHNNLGTLLSPIPFAPASGGAPGSNKFAAHLWGHYGKSQSPWPYAMLTGGLNAAGSATDLSDFKAVEFQTKGNGKAYSVILARSAVEDYCNFRQNFKTGRDWAKVSLALQDFKQPSWGRQIPLGLSDVLYFAFSPNADFSDEDLDFWIDDVTLVK